MKTVRLTLSLLLVSLTLTPATFADTLKVKKGESIQKAIEDANPGDTVKIAKGTYNEVLVVPDTAIGLKIVGSGAVLDALIDGVASGTGITVFAENVSISGLTIVHARSGTNPVPNGNPEGHGIIGHADGLKLEKLRIAGIEQAAIQAFGEDTVVSRVTVESTGTEGIFLAAPDGEVTKCCLHQIGQTAIYASGENVLVQGNRISAASIGIVMNGGEGGEVLANQVEGARDFSISLEGASEQLVTGNRISLSGPLFASFSNELEIVKNTIEQTTHGPAIQAQACSKVEISTNRIKDVANGHGVEVFDNGSSLELIGNRIEQVRFTGIALASVEKATVSKNRITDSHAGITYSPFSNGGLISQNKIVGASRVGIESFGSTFIIEKNSISKGVGSGISIGGSNTHLEGNKVSNLLGEGLRVFAGLTSLKKNSVSKTRSPITDDAEGNNLDDLGGNKFGKNVSLAPGAVPTPAAL